MTNDRVAGYREAQRRLCAVCKARDDATPNLRDFGFERRAEYEVAVAAHHALTAQIWQTIERIASRRMAIVQAQRGA